MDSEKHTDFLNYFINKDKKYPERIYNLSPKKRDNEKANFRRLVKPFNVKNGTLYHGDVEAVTRDRVPGILLACHDNPATGGHFGRDKTYQKIQARYWWKGMKADIEKYIQNCEKCFEHKPKLLTDRPELHPIPVPSKAWSLVGIDCITNLPETARGNKNIVAASDHFSKWTEAVALPDKYAASVGDFLYKLILRHGCMDTLISDQGREFVNQVVDHIMDKFNTEHRISSAYHPQTNGQREKDNKTLKDALRKVSNENCDDWDLFIDEVLFAHRTSVHASTGLTPHEVLYGRKAKLPMDLQPHDDQTQMESVDSVLLESLIETRKRINEEASKNIEKSQARQKKNYDHRHDVSCDIKVGDIVAIKNSKRIHRMGDKMKPLWIGKYIVVDSLGKGRLRLQNADTGKKLSNTYHASNVKLRPKSAEEPDDTLSAEEAADEKSSPKCQTPAQSKPVKRCRRNSGEEESVPKRQKTPGARFNPIDRTERENLATALGLKVEKSVYYTSSQELTQPRRIHKIKGDGNCYFRSISFILTGVENNHLIIRDRVVQHMHSAAIGQKLTDYLDKTVTDYLSSSLMDRDGAWATDAEIISTANLLGCDINVYCKVGEKLAWQRFPSQFTLSHSTDASLYLDNSSGDHYNVILSVQ